MSELTFSCPSCGQHIQCEKAYGGHVIHCPNCCAELRIPFSNTALPTELTVAKAQLVLEPSEKSSTPTNPTTKADVHCICPVCQSELRVPAGSRSDAGPTTAELVRAREPIDKPATDKPDESPAEAPHKTHTDHEQEIAAARAAHPIQLNPSLKPRMSYILSGTQPPSSESAPASEPNKEPGSDNHKSLNE